MATEVEVLELCRKIGESGLANCVFGSDPKKTGVPILDLVKAIGPAVAIMFGLLGIALNHWLNRRSEAQRQLEKSKRLASALAGEIESVREHIVSFRYVSFFRALRIHYKKDKNTVVPPRNSSGDFFVTYDANAGDIGILPSLLAEDVANVYTRFVAIQEELRTSILPEWNACPIENKLPTVEHLISELTLVRSHAANVVEALKKYANSPNG